MPEKFQIDFLEDYDKQSLIEELKRIQKIVGDRSVTKSDIDKYGRAGWTTYFKKFGSFSDALLQAGLKPSRRVNTTDEELINAVIELWTTTLEKEGRRPFASDLKGYGFPYCQDTYRRRFGSWKKALILAYNSVDKKDTQEQNENLNEDGKSKPYRKEISIRRRFLVLKRDQFTCVLCGRSGIGAKLEVDHKIPISKGGNNNLNNLQTLCYECNRGKRNDNETTENH
ncbi:MAG: HNH endonuclease [Thaumarchaeota archaeon]|nr:HNH endonuclease [Nitrososphaerota archaeon]